MGEQFIDLFAAGAYALDARIFAALSQPGLAWLFYLLAATGMIAALLESALLQQPDRWLRHFATVAVASVLLLMPQRVDLAPLTYGAPGKVETLFGTRTGAAPHLTYLIERLGAVVAGSLRSLVEQRPTLIVPGVAEQVAQIAGDPASVADPQLKANLEIWRRRIVPQILRENPSLQQQLQSGGLLPALLNPAPDAPQFIGEHSAAQRRAVAAALGATNIDLGKMVGQQDALIRSIAQQARAAPWGESAPFLDPASGAALGPPAAPSEGAPVLIQFAAGRHAASDLAGQTTQDGYFDALHRGDVVATELRGQLPAADRSIPVKQVDELYRLLGASVLYAAGVRIGSDATERAAIGSLCQRAGEAACRLAQAPLIDASTRLRVVEPDRYNTVDITTLIDQPLTTLLLTVASVMIGTLSSLVVSILPFLLGVAKAMAILLSTFGLWMLLWPGRVRIAISWMTGPIAFVSVWGVLFNAWGEIESMLCALAGTVADADDGSWSATRVMSIAISLGYLGLPSLALGIVYGESGRALYRASGRIEHALTMAWNARHAMIAFGRRWLTASPLARRWNQRAYRAVGLGALRATTGRRSPRPPSKPVKAPKPRPAAK